MADPDKVREDRLRRMATRQGLRLSKNPRRDIRAVDYGSYMLTDARSNGVVADFGWDHPGRPDGDTWLDDIETYLLSTEPRGVRRTESDNTSPGRIMATGGITT